MEATGGVSSKKECSSKASSDDQDSTNQSADDASSGRFYECIFCKRGFSTAQALGGHMNIHRKDRAKMSRPTPTASRSGDSDEPGGGYEHYNPYFNYSNPRSFCPPVSESLKNYSMLFPVSPSLGEVDVMGSLRPRELCLFVEDNVHLSLKVRGEGRHVVLGDEERMEGELDLELRLGHEP